MFPEKTIVIDNGAHTIKVGYASEEKPLLEVPTSTEEHPDSPIKRGVIVNCEAMNSRLDYVDEELAYAIWNSNVLITDPAHGPIEQKLRIAKRMFRNYLCANLCVADPGVLAVNSLALSTGISVDIGYDKTRITLVYNSEVIKGGFNILPIGGRELDCALSNLLQQKVGYQLPKTTLADIKEKHAYVNVDVDGSEAAKQVSYELPDGQMIQLQEECFQCPEILFDPELADLEGVDGLPEMIMDTVSKLDSQLKKELLKNVVLSGGSACLQYLKERLEKELKKKLPNEFSTRVLRGEGPGHSAWKGGALRARLTRFQKMCISSEEYDKIAPSEDSSRKSFIEDTKLLEDLFKERFNCC